MTDYPRNVEGLIAEFPDLFGNVECGVSFPDEWYPVLRQLGRVLESLQAAGDSIVVGQVKEKFGGLRVYLDEGPDAAFDVIDLAELAICYLGAP